MIVIFLSVGIYSCGNDEEVDICESVFCNSGGDCVNGECVCRTGFSGTSCENENMPSSMKVIGVSTEKFPELDGVNPWDNDGSGPDLYFEIRDGNNNLFYGEKIAKAE